ncbi:MAG: hypothetical protein Q8O37_00600 [Sulfuricellaceae bacterium]|jgi:hypothetical protein|nr:hypothetical protein [Sulfuricellaceae bacterium]
MLTIDFELEQSLRAIAEQEHSSPDDIIKKMISHYLLQRQSQKKPGSESIPPLTRSLTGLLAKSDLSELDYRQHLVDKHL